MSQVFSAETSAIRAYSASEGVLASQIAAAGAADSAAVIAALGPAFGLIGGPYLVAYAGAQLNHLRGVGHLAALHGGISAATAAAATAIDTADDIHAASFELGK